MSQNGSRVSMNELLEVELPVCPKCGHVGKISGRTICKGKLNMKCIGPEGKGHPATHMKLKLFREVLDVEAG